LHAGTRRANDAYGTARRYIAKTQSNPVDDGCAAIGSHEQQSFARGQGFETPFLFNGNIIAEEKYVQPKAQRLLCL
jgi:hypothetical protein